MKESVRKKLEKMKEIISEQCNIIEEMGNDMKSEYDDKSEAFREGEKGDAMQDAIDKFGEIQASLEDAERALEEAVEMD